MTSVHLHRYEVISMVLLACVHPRSNCESKDVESLFVISGLKSCVEKRSFYRIEDQEKWKQVWQQHNGVGTIPATIEFDFKQTTVVAIFDGKDGNNHGIDLGEIAIVDGKVVIRYRISYYGVGASHEPKETNAFAFIVLPKTSKSISIEENCQTQKRGAPVWECRGTFDKK